MCILYLGSSNPGSTSIHMASALGRLGHQVVFLDPAKFLPSRSKLRAWIDYRSGYRFCQKHLRFALIRELSKLEYKFTLVWVNSGELLGPSILRHLRSLYACPIVLYCNDDPTGPRDWNRFASLRASLSIFDYCICCRQVNELEMMSLGATNVLRMWMTFDEQIHYVDQLSACPEPRLSFIGTNIPAEHRDRFLKQILDFDVPMSIYGSRWQRSRFWPQLRAFCHQGFVIDSDYTALLSQSALCLGLLSHRNRDLHTKRTLEAPAAFSVLLAERTSEHQLLYEDGVEALFWQTPEECAQIVKQMLANTDRLASVRSAGHERLSELALGNEDLSRRVLDVLASVTN